MMGPQRNELTQMKKCHLHGLPCAAPVNQYASKEDIPKAVHGAKTEQKQLWVGGPQTVASCFHLLLCLQCLQTLLQSKKVAHFFFSLFSVCLPLWITKM